MHLISVIKINSVSVVIVGSVIIFVNVSPEDMGQFLYHLDPDTRKITRVLKK